MSGAIRAVALDISKAFDRAWYVGVLHKLKSYGISGQIFGLISFNCMFLSCHVHIFKVNPHSIVA